MDELEEIDREIEKDSKQKFETKSEQLKRIENEIQEHFEDTDEVEKDIEKFEQERNNYFKEHTKKDEKEISKPIVKEEKKLEFNDEEKKQLLQIFKEYPQKENLKKLKVEIEFTKISKQYVETLKPFLEFVSMKNISLKDKFKIFLQNENFHELLSSLDRLESTMEFGKHVAENKIKDIIKNNLENLNILQALIFYLISEDTKKSKEVPLGIFKFKDKLLKKIQKPKKEKKKIDKPNFTKKVR